MISTRFGIGLYYSHLEQRRRFLAAPFGCHCKVHIMDMNARNRTAVPDCFMWAFKSRNRDRLYPIPRHQTQSHGQQHAHGICWRPDRHHRQAMPWSSTFLHKAAVCPRPDGCGHTSGTRHGNWLPRDHRHRRYICPSCRENRSCRPAGTAARQTDTRRSSTHNRCTGPCCAGPHLPSD